MILWGDLETFSEVPLKNGTYIYAENSEVMLFTYAIDDGPIECWDLTADPRMPDELQWVLEDDDVIVWFQNSMFDRTVLNRSRNLRVPIAMDRWRDTMVQALAHSMPGALEKLGNVFKLSEEETKSKAGKKLIHLFCKPQGKKAKHKRATRHTHPAEWAEFIEYAKSDIRAMRIIGAKLPIWNYQGFELDLWRLDQKINDRGMCIDMELVRAAIRAVDKEQKQLAKRTSESTGGAVASATQRDKLLAYILQDYGVDLPDMQASTLERRINDTDLPIELRTLLAIRLQATTSSTSKYAALARGVSADGRLRGTKQFCGALRTGRWAGRMFQPDNLPRPTLDQAAIELGIEALKIDAGDLVTDNVMSLTSNAIRGCIVSPPGKKLVVSDLSNIEGRMGAWFADEKWKLQAFREYDAGIGPDLYKLSYAKAFGIDPAEVSKLMRQIGKVLELFLQYQGGVGAFITGAMAYGVDLDVMAETGYETVPADVLEEAEGFLEWSIKESRNTYGLDPKVFVVCDSFKRLWRRRHTQIVLLWGELEDAVRTTIMYPGETIPCRRFKVRRDGSWLRIVLPSGRALCYPMPRVSESNKISYLGVNQYSRQWQRIYTYGGKLFENLCQAGARDVMAAAMPLIENAGYQIVLTVHDEVLTEAPDTDQYSVDELSALLSTQPIWADGLPLSASGFEGYRYRKD